MPDSATLLSYAPQALILVAAVAAGFVNAIAGGGTFVITSYSIHYTKLYER